jgi:DNA repair protein RecN (Recombination protein N)
MLKSLKIENYALIERSELEWGPRLNLITGETGAGKSMVVEAMGLVLGRRADAGVLRDPDKKCVVEATFAVCPDDWKDLEEIDDPGDEIVIRREILPSGKSRAFVNDTPANLQTLKKITDRLADVHAQNESVLLQNPDVQMEILDKYSALDDELKRYSSLFGEYRQAQTRLDQLRENRQRSLREAEFLRFQYDELNKAGLKPGEDDALEAEILRMSRAEEIGETISARINELENDENAVVNVLAAGTRALEKLSSICPELAVEAQKLAEARLLVADAVAELERIAQNIEHDPRTAERLQRRHNQLNKLKVKYGAKSVDELIAMAADIAGRLADMESADEQIPVLEGEIRRMENEILTAAAKLESRRQTAASRLDARVNDLLEAVGFKGAAFYTEIARIVGPLEYRNERVKVTPKGFNAVRFMVKTNVGMPFGPLDVVASGGEISRILLALKTALADEMELSTLIFDEIDTGVGGETALKVGRVLETLAEKHQVLAVTHLPQIAARKGNHYYVYKVTENGKTTSHIVKLEGRERETEIAKMMSGAETPSDAALRSARELIAG